MPKSSSDYETVRTWIAEGAPLWASCLPADAGAVGFDGGASDTGAPDAAADADAAASQRDASLDASRDSGRAPDATTSDAALDAAGGGDAASTPSYALDVHPLLVADCASCHSASGAASNSGLLLVDDPAVDYPAVLGFVTVEDPSASPLLTETAGQDHDGGERFATSSSEYQTLLDWIEGGAPP